MMFLRGWSHQTFVILNRRAERAEALVKAIESAWQDAELRAEKAEARLRELEAES
jgi:hypothetical protein